MCNNLLFIDWQPDIELLNVGSFSIRWYSIMWIVGLALAYFIVKFLYEKQQIPKEKFDPLFIYCFFGVIIGARLGHCLFYEPTYFLGSMKGFIEMFLPIRFAPDSWNWAFCGYSGLASHGGAIGVFIGMLLYMKKTKVPFMTTLDNVSIAAPITACFIRLGNLMNSEIIGCQTDVPWAFLFHTREAVVDGQIVPRHPAQLYEAIAYFIIFVIGFIIYAKHNKTSLKSDEIVQKNRKYVPGSGFYFGYCIATIFLFRFCVEFIKKEQVDFERAMILDMGQILSIPFIIIGLYFLFRKSSETKNK